MRRELILGAVQGPAELLPVSSSAHARLLGAAGRADEVAVHAGTAVALLWRRPRIRPWLAALSVAPPAAVAVVAEEAIERRLGSRRALAAGLTLGSVALWLAPAGGRDAASARPADALALGAAQALALWPGVSRSAATVVAARARGFSPDAAAALARETLVPVLVAATVRVAPRLRARHVPAAAAAAASTAIADRLVGPPRSLRPFAAYRLALAVLAVWQDRRR